MAVMDMEKAKQMQIEVCETAKAMAAGGLTAGTWGNIAGRIDDTYMVVTPSGMLTSLREVHFSNAPEEILLSPSGSSATTREEQA